MSDTNIVVIEGRVVRNAEMKNAGNATVISFSIANSKSRKDGETWEEYASFFDCELWNRDGMLKHLIKGRALTVTGELRQESWKTQDGKTNSRVKIVVHEMSVRFPPKNEGNTSEVQNPPSELPNEFPNELMNGTYDPMNEDDHPPF